MMSFWHDIAVLLIAGLLTYAIVDALARLGREVREMRMQIQALAEGRPITKPDPSPKVYNAVSEDREYQSVTARSSL